MVKTVKYDVNLKANSLITVVGRDLGAISANKVESVMDYLCEEARYIIAEAKTRGKYISLISDEQKIKSIVLMDNGKVYPSTFRVVTLMERIKEATTTVDVPYIEKRQ